MSHGLVIGKFYPPHAGHHHLIDAALAGADRVTVVVAAASHESVPLALRAAWLAERHPAATIVPVVDDHPVDYDDPAIWDAHMAVFTGACPDPVDLVFTSEAYGPELARRFGARHVSVDPARERFPISGSAVRADPAAAWAFLEPAVRAWLTKRIAVVGAESTGTTTLAMALADHYGTAWVPEYGRAFTEELVADGTAMDDLRWNDGHFAHIARTQAEYEDVAARRSGPVLICDTDPLATGVWQERYCGRSTADVEAVGRDRTYALHILTADDVPFVQDGLRDGEHLRGWMTERFRQRLTGRDWIEVHGTPEQRLAQAVSAIDARLRWTFEEPLG